MKKRNLIATLAFLVVAAIYFSGVEVRQSPPVPDCALDPELCQGP